jgi:SanA protein
MESEITNQKSEMKFSLCKKGFVTLGALATMVLMFPFAASLFMREATQPYLYKTISATPSREVALVLGAAAYPSRLSDILQDRVDTAIDLYNAGKAKILLMSGSPLEVEKMADYAKEKGVKPEELKLDPQGLNTLASIQNAAKGNQSLIIVSQNFHLPRAVFMARHLGLDAIGISADRHEYLKIFDFEERELLASTKAMMDLFWPLK